MTLMNTLRGLPNTELVALNFSSSTDPGLVLKSLVRRNHTQHPNTTQQLTNPTRTNPNQPKRGTIARW